MSSSSTSTTTLPRLYSLFLSGLYASSLSIPTFLHAHNVIHIDTLTWLIVVCIELTFVLIGQYCLLHRIRAQFKNVHVYNMVINLVFVPIAGCLLSEVIQTLLTFSFLYHTNGNDTIDITTSPITIDQYWLLSALDHQLNSSIFGGLLFSLELYAELFRSVQQQYTSESELSKLVIPVSEVHSRQTSKKTTRY